MTVWLWLYDYDYDCITTVWQLYECITMTVMTENKLDTNQQQEEQEQVEKWYLEPPFAVKNILLCSSGALD
jgi:hypothetical protein